MDVRTAAFPERAAKQSGRSWLRGMVAALDEHLRLRHGIFEYTRNPDCLFRIRFVIASEALVLSDGVAICPGDRLVDLHVWNEQFPAFPANGPTLNWGRRVSHSFDASLRELAYFLKTRRDLDDVVAVCGKMAFGSPECGAQFVRFVGRFGFEPIAMADPPSLRQRLHRFGENILISLMVLARNAAALRRDTLWRGRLSVACSRRKLQRRYGFAGEQAP